VAIGDVIDSKYEIVQELGRGGMGAVYEAVNIATGRRVALKLIVSEALAKDSDVLVRFKREARTSGSIDSPYVVQVLDSGVDPATRSPYMVMELLAGEDVQQLVKRLGPLPPDLVLRILLQACMGLERAHQRGIVHRDIKSANMYLARRDGDERVLKLLDFGIAKVRADQLSKSDDHGLTRSGAMLGSPLYMSPEQARGSKNLDARSDLFSLGVVMYEALTGTTPNGQCDTLGELILAICSKPAEPVQDRAPWVVPEIAAIVHKALAVDAGQRFQTSAEMHAAIAALCPEGSIHETMIAAVSSEMRAEVASRYEPPPVSRGTEAPAQAPTSSPSFGVADSSLSSIAVTTGGVGRSAAATDILVSRPRSARARWLVPMGLLFVTGVGLGSYKWRSRPADATTASVSANVASGSPKPVAPTSSSVLAAGPRMVQVSIIAPVDAKVEVDGALVEMVAGKVELRGAVGSVHPVRVSANGRDAKADIVIADTGPVPARLELVAVRAPEAGTAPVHTAHTAGAHAAAVVSAMTTSAPARSPAPQQIGGAPTISRTF
jgi:serine/threonine-protein kinase